MTDAAMNPQDDTVILFEEGVIGIPRARRFELLEREGLPVRILRCLDIEGFSLPVVDPRLADPSYGPAFDDRVASILGATREEPPLMLAVAALGPDGAVANLKAPVLVNVIRRTAVQVILDEDYPLRAPVDLGEDRGESA